MFVKTTSNHGHYHVAWLNEAQGAGAASLERGHRHEVIRSPEADPARRDLLDWMVAAAEDGHTHQLAEIERDTKGPAEKDETRISAESVELFKSAVALEYESRIEAAESEKFYEGDQWPEDVKRDLEASHRACLTINHVEPMVDMLGGYQRQNRQDIKFLPVEGGDQKVADLLTILVKVICDQAGMTAEETQVFEDQVITGRGVFHVYVDDSEDERGRVMIEYWPWSDVWFGPHQRPDLRDCEYAIKARWFSLDAIKQLWPDKADELGAAYSLVDDNDNLEKTELIVHGRQYDISDGKNITPFNAELVSIARKEIRVYEILRREYVSVYALTAPDGARVDTAQWPAAEAVKASRIAGVKFKTRNTTRMRRTIMAGMTLLRDEYPDLPAGVSFGVYPAYGKRRSGKFWGKVKAAKDPQREINKRHSQAVDVVNKAAAYGWFYDKETFPNTKAKRNFLKSVNSPGFVLELSDSRRMPTKVEGVKFPSEMSNLVVASTEQFREITGVSMQWVNGAADMTGAALIERRRQGLTANEFLFDNLAATKRMMARDIVAWIKKIYTPERVARVVMGQAKQAPGAQMMIDQQQVSDFTMEDIAKLFDTVDLAQYDVVVGESAWSPTYRRAAFAQWSDLAARGVQVPMRTLVGLSDLPDKDKVLQDIDAQNQAAAQAEKAKADMELGKTALAKGIDPKAVTQQ